jgi:aryl-alcohol dehydrogenase-like predicted oxidoreductase
VEYLDVYFCHRFDQATPVEQTLRALDGLVRSGKIRCYGVSNWAAWQIARSLGDCGAWGITPIQVVQPMYSLAKRTAEIELLPMARAENLGVISYSPLGGGLLTGKYSAAGSQGGRLRTLSTYARRYADRVHYETAERLMSYAAERGISPVTLAVAWAGAHPGITAPIIGARNLEQLRPALAAVDYVMSPEEWTRIASMTPPVPPPTDRAEEVGPRFHA